jgi:hypothetical protein
MVSMLDPANSGAQNIGTRLRSSMPGIMFAEQRW